MTRALLYGGSFDPPHNGHIFVPLCAMEYLNFDSVLYMPAFQSPLKKSKPTAGKHRLAMLRLALADSHWATISTLELERGGMSYTIDTVEALRDEYDEIRLLVGADQWEQFNKWHRWEDIIAIANPAIMPREGTLLQDERVLPITPLLSASSTIRDRIKHSKSIENLMPLEVTQYIAQNQLYV
jgi:nicotinate-nucleotide adenylyltransferase